MQIMGTPEYPDRWAGIDVKLTSYSWIFIVFMVGWFACIGYYKVSALWDKANTLHRVETTTVPRLNKENWSLKHEIQSDAPAAATSPKNCPD